MLKKNKLYLTCSEVAERDGKPMRTIRGLCKRGAIHGAENVAGRWLIPADVVIPYGEWPASKKEGEK